MFQKNIYISAIYIGPKKKVRYQLGNVVGQVSSYQPGKGMKLYIVNLQSMSLFHYTTVSLQWKTKTLFCGKLNNQYLQMMSKQCIMKNL